MIQTNEFLESNLSSISDIIKEFKINEEFSSHDFIQKFIGKFENEYIEMLVNQQKTGRAFQNVNGALAKFLSIKSVVLEIKKTELKESENVRGNVNNVSWWIRF